MIRLLDIDDMEPATVTKLLWHLLEERPAQACISHKAMPSFKEHTRFVMHHPYTAWYIIGQQQGNEVTVPALVGAIYLTDRDEIGIGILRQYQCHGYATQAIEELKKLQPRPRYLANVAPGNEASHVLFSKLGHVVQHTYEIGG